MKKSVYSIVLADDVVKAVDEEAYRRGTSRSNLINQILAENLSCVTPEMRMRDIFKALSDIAGRRFAIQEQRSASLMTLRAALEYKYRPTISYKVELERVPGEYVGTIRAQIRTQSEALAETFCEFFRRRAKMESEQLARLGYKSFSWEASGGGFSRKLLNSGLSEEELGEAIGAYLSSLNRAVQIYFSDPRGFPLDEPALEAEFCKLISEYII